MATKKTFAAVLMLAVVLMAFIAAGEARECVDQCMPVCMRVEGATVPKCNKACGDVCDQLEGNSPGAFRVQPSFSKKP